MTVRTELSQQAHALPRQERSRILSEIKETELHGYLAQLMRALHKDYWVEVTHGALELGKDIVIVRNDPLSPDVIAVVVKRGDIRAKTAGDVDELKESVHTLLSAKGERITAEILSQIAQAKEHDAELAPFFHRLKVSKVIVVLVGDMSNSARARIEKEIGTAGQVFDLPWLVDTFTDHYPQIFFDGRAVDFLDSQLQQLERDSFYSKSGKTLSECFVEPVVAQLDNNVSLDDVSLAVHVRNKRIRFSQLASVVAQTRCLLLVGDPGSGKSKAVAKLCIDNYRRTLSRLTRSGASPTPQGIPVILAARRLQDLTSSEELVAAVLPLEVRERFVVQTLIVDGLDEVVAAHRDGVLGRAREIANQLDACLVVTSRKIAALNAPPTDFERYELLPFEFSQAMKLMQNVLANAEVLPALRDGLQRIQAQIPMNPLSLLLLVELVAERKEVPSSITELYDRFLDLVFGRWDQEKGVQVLFEYVVKKRFLAAFAYHEFHQRSRLEIPAADFDRFLSNYATQYGWDDDKLRDFLKEVERAGIIEVHDEVYFRHRSFLDYFVALYVFEQRTTFEDLNGTVTALYFDGLWSEVAFFYAGLGREVSGELLDCIFEHTKDGDGLHIDKLLVGRLLQAGWHSPTKVKESGIRRALSEAPAAASAFRELLGRVQVDLPLLYSDLVVLILAETSFGSTFLSQEGVQLLAELENAAAPTLDDFLKRAGLLWASRRYLPPEEHTKRLKAYVAAVESASLEPLDEARLLLLGAAADTANAGLLKSIGRRLKRLAKRAPAALQPLLPKRKKGFRRK